MYLGCTRSLIEAIIVWLLEENTYMRCTQSLVLQRAIRIINILIIIFINLIIYII